jgi:hypothetical protein
MVNIYVEERVAQVRMAALERYLVHQQCVQAALAHHGSSTQPTGRYGRLMRWCIRRMPAGLPT